jgi:hypothetical protein
VGEGPPSMSFLAVISKFVDGQCLPTMTEMPKPESQPYRPLA